MGPPSGAGTCGTAASTYVPTSTNIRTEILSVRFMGSLLSRSLGVQNLHLAAVPNYKAFVKLCLQELALSDRVRASGITSAL